jgi:hemoglobin-like flavoprotein
MMMSEVMDWPARFEEMIDFVGLSNDDRQLIKDSGPLILDNTRRFTEALYDHLLKYPEAGKFFTTQDGQPDEKRIEDNVQTMISWLRASVTAPLNQGFIRYLVGISQMHENTPRHRPELSPVAPRYVIGTISYYQTVLSDLLHEKMSDPALAWRTSVAWNKWLMVMLELLLAQYLLHDR